MGDVHESIAVGRPRRNSHKPSWLTTDMIVAYALPVVEEAIPSTYKEAESLRCGRRDEVSIQEQHLGTDRVAQGKEGNWL